MAERTGLPPYAAWRHKGAREGFEVAFLEHLGPRLVVQGHTAAVEQGEPFVARYRIELDEAWRTRSAHVSCRSAAGFSEVLVEADGRGAWEIDGKRASHLEGCLDLDLESSALTNAFPVHRLDLEPGRSADAPAVYVRALDAGVERLEQRYERLADGEAGERYAYEAPAFDARLELRYDAAGLVLDYPGLARRADAG